MERRRRTTKSLQEVVLGETVAHDDVLDGVKYKAHVLGVRGARHVDVDHLALGAIERDELVFDVLDSLLVVAAACCCCCREDE